MISMNLFWLTNMAKRGSLKTNRFGQMTLLFYWIVEWRSRSKEWMDMGRRRWWNHGSTFWRWGWRHKHMESFYSHVVLVIEWLGGCVGNVGFKGCEGEDSPFSWHLPLWGMYKWLMCNQDRSQLPCGLPPLWSPPFTLFSPQGKDTWKEMFVL